MRGAPACAALLDTRAALTALRRTLPRNGPPVVACRSLRGMRTVLRGRVPEAVVLGLRALAEDRFDDLRAEFPTIPLVIFGVIRPDLGADLLSWHRRGVAGVAVQGVDDAVVGELVHRSTLSTLRRHALRNGPQVLRLREPIQQEVWRRLVDAGGRALQTGDLARELGRSREDLSRQFGAGGAPNLKRVIDLNRVATAAQLLANPGLPAPRVARLLAFSSSSHLSAVARRIAEVPASGLAGLGPGGVLTRFARGHTRSRQA